MSKEIITVGTDNEGDDITSCVWLLNNPWLTRYQLLKAEMKDVFGAIIKNHSGVSFSFSDVAKLVEGKTEKHIYRYIDELKGKGFIKKEKRDLQDKSRCDEYLSNDSLRETDMETDMRKSLPLEKLTFSPMSVSHHRKSLYLRHLRALYYVPQKKLTWKLTLHFP